MTLGERIVASLRQRRQCAQQLAAELGESLDDAIWPALVRLADCGRAYPLARMQYIPGIGRARLWSAA